MASIIQVIGDIDESAFGLFCKDLADIAAPVNGNHTVIIELCSHGGDPMIGFAFRGRMQSSPFIFEVRAFGVVSSAAVAILASGDYRTMSADTVMLLHPSSAEEYSGSVKDLRAEAKALLDTDERWINMLVERSTASNNTWTKLHDKVTYINAKKCLELGLIEEIKG